MLKNAPIQDDTHRYVFAAPPPTDGELRPLVRLALPIVVVNLGQQLKGLVDTALAGRIDALSLGATGLGTAIFMAGTILGAGLIMGIDPIVSQAFGAGKRRYARYAMWQGFYAAGIITVPIAFLILGLAHLLETFGVEAALAETTRIYVYGRLPGIFFFIAFVAARAYLQAAHITRPIVTATILSNVVNFIGDWVLAFGDGGLREIGLPALGIPAFGVRGLAWTTAGVNAFMFAYLAWVLRRVDPGTGPERLHVPNAAILRRVFSVGTPLGLQLLAELGIFAAVGVMMGGIGRTAMAAHQVALALASFTFMVPLAIGMATSVQVGRAVGRRDTLGGRRAGFLGIGLGGGFMLTAATAMWFFPEALARLISSDPRVVETATDLIRIAAAFQIFDGIQAVATGALRGAGITRWTLGANIVSYWFVALPVAAGLGFALRLGPTGLWWGLTAGLAVAALILSVKFFFVTRRPLAALSTST